MNREIFIKQKLFNGDEVTILKVIGLDVFNANRKSKGDQYNLHFYVMCEMCLVNDKPVTLEYIQGLSIDDFTTLTDVVGSQLLKVNNL